MSIGVNQLLNAASYFILAYYMTEARPFVATDDGLVHFGKTDPPGKSALLRHVWCCGADDHG